MRVATIPKISGEDTHFLATVRINNETEGNNMKFIESAKEKGAAGYILLWLLGIPIPILLIIFSCGVAHRIREQVGDCLADF